MNEIKCIKCGDVVEWDDTMSAEGGILEGYITEIQLYHCENCGKEYKAIVSAPIDNHNITIELECEEEEC
jgi:DNA-directed RNA polymerase subunit RPC12/RpoP